MDQSLENLLPPVYCEDGVDLSLIRWMLWLTPVQRLQFLQDLMNSGSLPNLGDRMELATMRRALQEKVRLEGQ